MELFFATGNKNKVKELAALIEDMDSHVRSVADVPDLVSPPRGTTGVIRGSPDARKKAERQDGGQSAAFSFFAMAAEMKPRNSGWGRLGRDLNSG